MFVSPSAIVRASTNDRLCLTCSISTYSNGNLLKGSALYVQCDTDIFCHVNNTGVGKVNIGAVHSSGAMFFSRIRTALYAI